MKRLSAEFRCRGCGQMVHARERHVRRGIALCSRCTFVDDRETAVLAAARALVARFHSGLIADRAPGMPELMQTLSEKMEALDSVQRPGWRTR